MNSFTGVLGAIIIAGLIWACWGIRQASRKIDNIVTQALADEAERLQQEADFQRWEASL